jgi:hypothetical protein
MSRGISQPSTLREELTYQKSVQGHIGADCRLGDVDCDVALTSDGSTKLLWYGKVISKALPAASRASRTQGLLLRAAIATSSHD